MPNVNTPPVGSLDKVTPSADIRGKMRRQLQISERRLILMIGDLLAVVLSIFISLRIWALVGHHPFNAHFIALRLPWFVALPLLWFFLSHINDFYNLREASKFRSSALRLFLITSQQLVIYLVIFFLSQRDTLPRLFMLYHSLISIVLIAVWRWWRPYLLGWPGARRYAVILGTGWAAETIVNALREHAPDDYMLVGAVHSEQDDDHKTLGVDLLGTGQQLPALVQREEVAELIVAYPSEIPADVFEGMMACYEMGVTIMPMPLLYEQITGRVPIEHVGQQHWSVVLPLDNQSVSLKLYLVLKRIIDICLAIIGLAAFLILLPLLALLMRLDSRGPIFFWQERVGRGGKIFRVVKLRSMIDKAEALTGAVWATENDPRITRLGKFFRKTRLDEVPQLWNVLNGDMSIVGPRPERAVFVDQLTQEIPFYRTRLVVKPGLTGWAQICYRYGNTTEDALIKLQYDLYYIRHQSIVLDTLIMARTIGKMIMLQGT